MGEWVPRGWVGGVPPPQTNHHKWCRVLKKSPARDDHGLCSHLLNETSCELVLAGCCFISPNLACTGSSGTHTMVYGRVSPLMFRICAR